MTNFTREHVSNLEKELEWLANVIHARLNGSENALPHAPILSNSDSQYTQFVRQRNLKEEERLVLTLCLAVHLRPVLFDLFVTDKKNYQHARLCKSPNGVSLLPTAETALFLLAGEDLGKRLEVQAIFEPDHIFYKESVIDIGETVKGQSPFAGILSLSPTFRDLFIANRFKRPRFSPDFPAHLLTTKLEWNDMILASATRARLEEVQAYLEHHNTLISEWGMEKHAKPGCRILFFGDSGTGKTLAATLLGKHLGKDVYRVDISAVTSKYIGETNKRLESLFNTAESKGWILFLDEGDALLGQRRATEGDNSANSHYANQEVAFLLQRIETYDGIIVVATNLRSNIDQAFTRRFQAMVRFAVPGYEGLLELWERNLPAKCPLASGIDLSMLIKRHTLSPAAIINVIFRAGVMALQHNEKEITQQRLELCIKDEELKYMGRPAMV